MGLVKIINTGAKVGIGTGGLAEVYGVNEALANGFSEDITLSLFWLEHIF